MEIQTREILNEVIHLEKNTREISKRTTEGVTRKITSQSGDESIENWETQTRRGFKRREKHINENTRPKPLRGTNENEQMLKTAEKVSHLFLSGFSPETEGKDILAFLDRNGIGDGCHCDRMKTIKDRQQSSFKLTVPLQKRDELMSPNLWLKDVLINHFRNLQNRPAVRKPRNWTLDQVQQSPAAQLTRWKFCMPTSDPRLLS